MKNKLLAVLLTFFFWIIIASFEVIFVFNLSAYFRFFGYYGFGYDAAKLVDFIIYLTLLFFPVIGILVVICVFPLLAILYSPYFAKHIYRILPSICILSGISAFPLSILFIYGEPPYSYIPVSYQTWYAWSVKINYLTTFISITLVPIAYVIHRQNIQSAMSDTKTDNETGIYSSNYLSTCINNIPFTNYNPEFKRSSIVNPWMQLLIFK